MYSELNKNSLQPRIIHACDMFVTSLLTQHVVRTFSVSWVVITIYLPDQMSLYSLYFRFCSSYKIPITQVWLNDCSPRVNKADSSICLDSGLSLPVINSLRDLSISDIGRTLTNEELVAFLSYSSECTNLKAMR